MPLPLLSAIEKLDAKLLDILQSHSVRFSTPPSSLLTLHTRLSNCRKKSTSVSFAKDPKDPTTPRETHSETSSLHYTVLEHSRNAPSESMMLKSRRNSEDGFSSKLQQQTPIVVDESLKENLDDADHSFNLLALKSKRLSVENSSRSSSPQRISPRKRSLPNSLFSLHSKHVIFKSSPSPPKRLANQTSPTKQSDISETTQEEIREKSVSLDTSQENVDKSLLKEVKPMSMSAELSKGCEDLSTHKRNLKLSTEIKRNGTMNTCYACKEELLPHEAQCIAMSHHWHPHHFVCYVCKTELSQIPFKRFKEHPHCKACYDAIKSSKLKHRSCAYCLYPILEKSYVSALGKTYHRDHFVCTHCSEPFQGQYWEVDGKPYCIKHRHIESIPHSS
eukprot:TRINITY_DN5440_c0_g3_i1.p1 TRINITY_DN5440_c0_g3~~TRINITY_DN5440_c0_g3_i1.p1  ORF type:complete len:390 (-),score=56.18 TRINITY_DN5440_c0_g3_i1:49-1218(-)